MSDEPTNPTEPDAVETPPESPEPRPLGCLASFGSMGLAMYALLVLSLLISSLTCGIMTLIQTWRMGANDDTELVSGWEVDSWRLSELRYWGVLEKGQTPTLYHDHSARADSSAGCMVLGDELILWTDKKIEKRLSIPGAVVSGTEELVRLQQGEEAIECPFFPGDGGDRLKAGLTVDAKRKAPKAPKVPAPPEPSNGD